MAAPRPAVLLVSMPFGPLFQPSLGLSLLQAGLAARGIASDILYFTLRFARRAGVRDYRWITSDYPASYLLAGEWIFSTALFPEHEARAEQYVADLLRGGEGRDAVSPSAIRRLRRLRGLTAPFLDDCARAVARRRPRVIGFSSVFQQQAASLALAKRIKARCPGTFIVFGGANCEATMGAEVVRQFPFVDAVVSGEGDVAFPELVERVARDGAIDGCRGVYTRRNVDALERAGHYPNAAPIVDMNALPYPSFDDYFRQFRAARLDTKYSPRLLFESARGCWWGERSHCTFCGLNGATMMFRSKSAPRALEELTFLTSRYRERAVMAVDNILDLRYLKDLLPALAVRRPRLDLFYEVKANLKKHQVRLLRDAGVSTIQPGIESLSSTVLALIRKGSTALQNVQLLKWCRELGVDPLWNIIWGFPGEPPADYAAMARLVPRLSHLPPPQAATALRLDRFSPYFERPGEFGVTGVAPAAAYGYIFPLPPEAIARLAYYFTSSHPAPADVAAYTATLTQAIAEWQRLHRASVLFFEDFDRSLAIWDTRLGRPGALTVLRDPDRAAYLACDAAQPIGRIVETMSALGPRVTERECRERLQRLVECGLMLRDGESVLSLALPVRDFRPPVRVYRDFRRALQQDQYFENASSG